MQGFRTVIAGSNGVVSKVTRYQKYGDLTAQQPRANFHAAKTGSTFPVEAHDKRNARPTKTESVRSFSTTAGATQAGAQTVDHLSIGAYLELQVGQPARTESVAPFTTSSAAKLTKEQAVERFVRVFDQMKNRPAFGHPLFKVMTRLARNIDQTNGQCRAGLTKQQFATFREYMLARIYLTMPAIARHAEYALLAGDYQMFAMALQNLREEGADGNVNKMHPILAERAFNAIGREFGLPDMTMKQAFENLISKSNGLKQYADVINRSYSTNPAFISLAQEVASGGDGKSGMMADLYEFFEALRPSIDPKIYQEEVLPYFQEHLSLHANGEYREHADEGIECQHGRRALDDAKRCVNDEATARSGLTVIRQFAEVQESLFNEIQTKVRYLPKQAEEEMRDPKHVL